ncbi:FAD-binding protein, partial [Endozoicomonas sp.]|uniref:FAD-binding protein n=1 Tax=Endozoicomonas sp. TaxID=1892382 RepID=UPI00383B5057
SMDPLPFSGSKLGAEFENLRPTTAATLMLGRMSMTMKEARVLLCRGNGFLLTNMKIMGRYYGDVFWRFKSKRDRYLTLGNALIAALRASMLDRNISLWLNSPMESLIEENGQVIGIVVNRDGKRLRVKARKGVIIGAGGFESNQAMREQYHPQPSQALWSAAPEGINTGDGIQAGQELGAATALMEHSWWAPTSHVEGETRSRAMFVERALPNCILVNKAGKRFINEAAPYNDFGDGMYGTESVPCWFVFDAQFRHKYPCGALLPGYAVPDKAVSRRYKDYYQKAATLKELAENIGVDVEGLQETVTKYNQYSVEGSDPEFGKGDSLFDRYYGDPNVTPNPCLGPLEKGPFYAVKINIGDIGTKGGLVTNVDGQVLREDGEAIPGLYAIGNTSASVMKQTYPGAGSTIGPAMTFGYLSANHIAQRQVDARIVKAEDADDKNQVQENKNAVEA